MPAKRTTKKHIPVEVTKHKDKRKNIPTEELSDFIRSDEKTPSKVSYPRDPSLDPQLVWKGKEEQDSEDLEVPAVPIYIQEKVHPKALVENLRRTAERGADEPELTLFDDFNGLEFEQEIDFYQHEHNWSNRMVLGDSLLVMSSLAEKEGLKGKVQMIYIDPPYGIKFGSNWQVSTRKRDVKDSRVEEMTRQPEQVKAFRDTWELGIHSYLSYLRDRLVAARDLLTESGSIFVQIGDENVHRVRVLLDEVFGPENFVSQIALRTTSGAGSQSGTVALAGVASYLLWYATSKPNLKYRQLHLDKESASTADLYTLLRLPDGTERRLTDAERADPPLVPAGARRFRPDNLVSQSQRREGQFPVEVDGKTYRPSKGYWKTNPQGMERLNLAGRLRPTIAGTIQYVRFLDDFPAMPINNVWTDVGTGSFTEEKIFIVQTPVKVIQRCLLMTTDPGDLVLDPTCGSGTTAYVAEHWARRWITVDTSRVALALARTRLMTGPGCTRPSVRN